MKVGDLVRVVYRDGGLGSNQWEGPWHGIICMTPDDHAAAVWQMWCIERQTLHILSPGLDKIEVISES